MIRQDIPAPRRRMLAVQFTIRDLFWAMTLVAVTAAWWWDHSRLLQILRRHSPMAYEVVTGTEIDTNNKLLRERAMKEFNSTNGSSSSMKSELNK